MTWLIEPSKAPPFSVMMATCAREGGGQWGEGGKESHKNGGHARNVTDNLPSLASTPFLISHNHTKMNFALQKLP